MKVYIIAFSVNSWQNGQLIYAEAKRQKLDVEIGFVEWPFNHLLREIKRSKPDWIFLTGSRAFPPEKLVKLANIAKLAIWCPDDVNSKRLQIWEDLKGIPSVIFTTVTDLSAELAIDEVVWIPQYYDDEYYKATVPLTGPYVYDACFFGGMDKKREEWITKLKEKYNIFVADNIFGPQMSNIYRQSKLSFGIWRDGYSGGDFACSDRIFKAIGSGCCYLHHTVKNPELLFKPGKHFDIYFDTYETLDEMIEYYLENHKHRESIRLAGRVKVLANHTLTVRIPQYWEHLK